MKIRLIHWNPDEGGERVGLLERKGIAVDFEPFEVKLLKKMGEQPPEAVVIDLTRMPSQGRDVAIALRMRKSTRHIPIIFAGGSKEKVEGIMKILPDAVFSSWDNILDSIGNAIGNQLEEPVVPSSQFAGYAGRSLPVKLGISGGTALLLLEPPEGFEKTLGSLPDGVRIRKRAAGRSNVIIMFCRSMSDLEKRLERAKSLMAEGASLWIAWQKKTSGAGSDLTQASVRRKGLDSGLVDYKICSIDDTWSGLRFARRDN
jgi:CheY-like chemotaxis protein